MSGTDLEETVQDEQALEKALQIVEGVLQYIAVNQLGPTDSVLHIMTKSVEVQKTATLSQIRNYLSPNVAEQKRLLATVVQTIVEHPAEVQIACAKGLGTIFSDLDAETRALLFQDMHEVQFRIASTAQAAWRQQYHRLALLLDQETVMFYVLPLSLKLTTQDSSSKRVAGVRLLSHCIQGCPKLSTHTPVLQAISSLTMDRSSSVRAALAAEFVEFCRDQNPCLLREVIMLPLMRLLLDDDVKVSSQAFRTLVLLSDILDTAFVSSFVQPILLQYVTSCPPAVQEVVVMEFGRLLWNTRASLGEGEGSDCEYLIVVYLALTQSGDENFRRECAFNFPAVLATFTSPPYRSRLEPTFKQLCNDQSARVRRCMAAGFHEVCSLFGQGFLPLLQPCFMKLLSDPTVEVRDQLIQNLEKILFAFTAEMTPSESTEFFSAVSPMLVQYEKDISTNWRKVEGLLNPFQFFPRWFGARDLHLTYVPILIRYLVTGAVALRSTVCSTLALFLRTFSSDEEKVIAIRSVQKLAVEVGQSRSASGRIAFVDFCEQMMSRFSTAFFKLYLLAPLIQFKKDPVSNVRLRLAKSLGRFLTNPLLADSIKEELVGPLQHDPDADVRTAVKASLDFEWERTYNAQNEEKLAAYEGSLSGSRVLELLQQAEAQDREREAKEKDKTRKKGVGKSTTPGAASAHTTSPTSRVQSSSSSATPSNSSSSGKGSGGVKPSSSHGSGAK